MPANYPPFPLACRPRPTGLPAWPLVSTRASLEASITLRSVVGTFTDAFE
jgi:hypothetical protein